MEVIHSRVDAVRARQQRQWMWRCLSWGLVIGGLAGCVLGAMRLVAADSITWVPILAAMILGPAIGLIVAFLRPSRQRDAAVTIDRSCGFKDRVATAIGFLAEARADAPLRQLQIADAASHAARIDARKVAPIQAPRSWLWGLGLTATAIVVAVLTAPQREAVASIVPNDVVLAQASRAANSLEELREFNEQQRDPEVEELLKELAAKIEELQQPGVDPKEALAKLSEMESVLQEKQEQLADPSIEAALQDVGEALSLAEPFQAAGAALSQGKMEQAAEELEKLELPKLERQTERAVTEKLDQQAKQSSGDGPKRALREALGQMSQGLSQGDRGKFKDGMLGLAGESRKQGNRKKLSDLLRKQCQCLAECKGECESECKSTADSNKKGGKNWGLARSGNEPGDKTPKLKSGEQMKLTGQESATGEVDVETLSTPEQQQEAVRQYREQAQKYEQLSESVLESEPIPLGHRQAIRRYFEMIRPQDVGSQTTVE